jgi:hypothetical protein
MKIERVILLLNKSKNNLERTPSEFKKNHENLEIKISSYGRY